MEIDKGRHSVGDQQPISQNGDGEKSMEVNPTSKWSTVKQSMNSEEIRRIATENCECSVDSGPESPQTPAPEHAYVDKRTEGEKPMGMQPMSKWSTVKHPVESSEYHVESGPGVEQDERSGRVSGALDHLYNYIALLIAWAIRWLCRLQRTFRLPCERECEWTSSAENGVKEFEASKKRPMENDDSAPYNSGEVESSWKGEERQCHQTNRVASERGTVMLADEADKGRNAQENAVFKNNTTTPVERAALKNCVEHDELAETPTEDLKKPSESISGDARGTAAQEHSEKKYKPILDLAARTGEQNSQGEQSAFLNMPEKTENKPNTQPNLAESFGVKTPCDQAKQTAAQNTKPPAVTSTQKDHCREAGESEDNEEQISEPLNGQWSQEENETALDAKTLTQHPRNAEEHRDQNHQHDHSDDGSAEGCNKEHDSHQRTHRIPVEQDESAWVDAQNIEPPASQQQDLEQGRDPTEEAEALTPLQCLVQASEEENEASPSEAGRQSVLPRNITDEPGASSTLDRDENIEDSEPEDLNPAPTQEGSDLAGGTPEEETGATPNCGTLNSETEQQTALPLHVPEETGASSSRHAPHIQQSIVIPNPGGTIPNVTPHREEPGLENSTTEDTPRTSDPVDQEPDLQTPNTEAASQSDLQEDSDRNTEGTQQTVGPHQQDPDADNHHQNAEDPVFAIRAPSEAEAGVHDRREAGVHDRGEAGIHLRREAGIHDRGEAGIRLRREARIDDRRQAEGREERQAGWGAPVVDLTGGYVDQHCREDAPRQDCVQEVLRLRRQHTGRSPVPGDADWQGFIINATDADDDDNMMGDLINMFRTRQAAEGALLCVHCDAQWADTAFLNCHHVVMCLECASYQPRGSCCPSPSCGAVILCFLCLR